MIQAIKAVADFPNVVYLLSYSPEVAGHAIEEALRVPNGRAYLEKIVQVPQKLPLPPAHKIQAHAKRQLGNALGIAPADAPIQEALTRAAALMRTPRDVERLHTRLVLSAEALRGEIALDDLMLIEAIDLVCPALVEWVQDNHRMMLRSGAVEEGDADLAARIPFGRLEWERIAFRPEDIKAKHEESTAQWQQLARDSGFGHAVIQAMKYVFDAACGEWSQEPHAANLRIQRLHRWMRWRAFIRHQEALEASDVLCLLASPHQMLQHRVLQTAADFTEFCAIADDLLQEYRHPVDSLALVDVWIEAAARLGSALVVGHHGGAPQLLERALRADSATQRLRALNHWIGCASPWLSHSAMLETYWDAHGREEQLVKDVESRLVGDAQALDALATTWLKKAKAMLEDKSQTWAEENPYYLAHWMTFVGFPADEAKSLLNGILRDRDRALAMMFDDYRDVMFRWRWERTPAMPDAAALLAALPRSPGFEQSHRLLVERWRSEMGNMAPPESKAASAASNG
jgi:hypothetical protein